jgi:hypothetical protein
VSFGTLKRNTQIWQILAFVVVLVVVVMVRGGGGEIIDADYLCGFKWISF